jgi:SAM-dependent methyltransferase
MSLLQKLGIVGVWTQGRAVPVGTNASHMARTHGTPAGFAALNPQRGGEAQQIARVSNGLKELLWNLDGIGRGTLLDLGPAWQTTLSFFIERGFRVSSEDLLRAWKEFLAGEEKILQGVAGGTLESVDMTAEGRAVRFLESNLQYRAGSFDAILLWDLLDYLEPVLARRVVSSLTDLLRPGGAVFAMFHSRKPEHFQRYRIADSMTLQMLPAKEDFPAQRTYQNREIQDLFRGYRTTKSFVSRDQLREVLFIK